MRTILVFGTFDNLHAGHRSFLSQAKKIGQPLVVAVAPDSVVQQIKGRWPKQPLAKRIQGVKDARIADAVIAADDEIDSWVILQKIKPETIALGFDQDALRQSLEQFLNQTYPEVEDESGNWRKPPKRPKIVVLQKF